MWENFIQVLKAVCLNWKEYGLHSLRSGGGSLTPNTGKPDRSFKSHADGNGNPTELKMVI